MAPSPDTTRQFRRPRRHCSPLLDSVDWLHDRYVTKGRTISQIAGELDVSDGTVTNALEDAGIDRRPGGTNPARYPQLRDPDWMIDAFVTRRGTIAGVARQLGCADTTVRVATRRRPVSTALAEAGWDPLTNVRSCQLGRPPIGEAYTSADVLDVAGRLGEFSTNELLTELGLPATRWWRINRLLTDLVDDGKLTRAGLRPIIYSIPT